jgi:hypothetical protein
LNQPDCIRRVRNLPPGSRRNHSLHTAHNHFRNHRNHPRTGVNRIVFPGTNVFRRTRPATVLAANIMVDRKMAGMVPLHRQTGSRNTGRKRPEECLSIRQNRLHRSRHHRPVICGRWPEPVTVHRRPADHNNRHRSCCRIRYNRHCHRVHSSNRS